MNISNKDLDEMLKDRAQQTAIAILDGVSSYVGALAGIKKSLDSGDLERLNNLLREWRKQYDKEEQKE